MSLPVWWAVDDCPCGNCGSLNEVETQVRVSGRRSRLQVACLDCGHVDCWLIDHDDTFGGPYG